MFMECPAGCSWNGWPDDVECARIELLGSGAEPLAAQLADEALQPPLRLDGIRQRRLCLGEARLQAFVLLSEGGVIHA